MGTVTNYSLPENIFQTIFDKSPGSILIKADSPRFTILAVNDSYLSITSSTRENILGKGFFEAFPDDEHSLTDETSARSVFTKVIKTCESVDVPTYKYDVYNTETGKTEPRYWSCCNVPVLCDDKGIAYILNTVTDITAEVKAREIAIESENRLRMATEATGLATWDMNLLEHKFMYSPRLAEIFGYNITDQLLLSDIMSTVSPEDMEHIVRPAHQQALQTGKHLYEVKIAWRDKSVHWIKTQGVVLYDNERKPVRLLGTVLDITESKRDEIRKNDFIAMASHELKTPLTSLKAYIQLLAKKITQDDDPFVNTALTKAHNQVNKMANLIYGFLDLSRLESGKLHLNPQQFDINKLVADCIAEINMVNYSHQIVFEPNDNIYITADMEKIGQVIGNFLSNAIKYSPKESPIVISAKVEDNNVVIAVTDKGIGIKPKDQEKLFQRFYRVENESIKHISGFGIGLYLASEIIQRHKGKIWVESQENKGSTFCFSLPLGE